MLSKIVLIIGVVLTIYAYLRILLMYLTSKSLETKKSAYERVIELTNDNNAIHLVETKNSFSKYNVKRKVIKLPSTTYNKKDVFSASVASLLAGYSLVENNFLTFLGKLNLTISYLSIMPVISLVITSIVSTKADAKIALIILIITTIYQYFIYDLNYTTQEKLSLKEKNVQTNLIKFSNISKLFFIANLVYLLRVGIIILGI